MSSPVCLLVCFDNNFLKHAAAVIESSIRHTPSIEVFAIVGDVKSSNKRILEKWLQRKGIKISFFEIGKNEFKEYPLMSHLSRMTYARLLAIELLPASCQRIIYLDCDLIVLNDLNLIWNIDLSDNEAGCVRDPWVHHQSQLGLEADTPYFNAGVMLLDLVKLRQTKNLSNAAKFVFNNPTVSICSDQDGLNVSLNGRWLEINSRWNSRIVYNYELGVWEANIPADEKPWIIHFAGADQKPWAKTSIDHPYRHEYYIARTKGPWPIAIDPNWLQNLRTSIKALFFK